MSVSDLWGAKRVAGIALVGDRAHSVLLRLSSSKPAVERVSSAELDDPEGLRRLLPRGGGTGIVLCVPRSLVVFSRLEVPSTDPKEVGAIVRNEALRKLPLSDDEFVCDFEFLERRSDGTSRVLLMVIRLEDLRAVLDRLAVGGIRPEKILTSMQSLASFVDLRGRGREVAFEIGPDFVGFDFYEDGSLLHSRTASAYPGNPAVSVSRELEVTLRTFDGRPFSTDGIRLTRLPFEGGEMPPGRSVDPGMAASVPPDFDLPSGPGPCLALGAALAAGGRVDFTPWEDRRRVILRRRKRDLLSFGAISAVIVGIWVGIGYRAVSRMKNDIKTLEAEWEILAPRVVELKKLAVQVRESRAEGARRTTALATIGALYESAPRGVVLSELSLGPDGDLIVRGTAPSILIAMDLVGRLGQRPIFKSVELKNSSVHHRDGIERVEFQIVGRVF